MNRKVLIFAIFLSFLIQTKNSHAANLDNFTDFDGDVDVHIKHMTRAEDLIQIIDHTRSVVCYGKMSSAGAATISCVKLPESSQKPLKK